MTTAAPATTVSFPGTRNLVICLAFAWRMRFSPRSIGNSRRIPAVGNTLDSIDVFNLTEPPEQATIRASFSTTRAAIMYAVGRMLSVPGPGRLRELIHAPAHHPAPQSRPHPVARLLGHALRHSHPQPGRNWGFQCAHDRSRKRRPRAGIAPREAAAPARPRP